MKNINQKEGISGKMPEKRFSTGAITAAIWKNEGISSEGSSVEFNSITLQRRYKDKEGRWQTTSNMRINDLPKASLVLQKAYEYLVLREGNSMTEEAA